MDNVLRPFDCDKLQPVLSTSKQDASELFVVTIDSDDSNGTAMPQLNRFDKDTFATDTEEMPILEISDESEDDNLLNFSSDIKLEVEEHELQAIDFELETEQELEFEEQEREVHERELHSNEHNLEADQELEIEQRELEVQERNNEAQEDDPCSFFDEYSSCSSDIWADLNTFMNEIKLDDNNALKSNERKRIRQKAVCHICGLILSRVDHLRIHIQGVHDTNKVYKCTHCDHTTNSKLYLQRHFKLNHSFVTELFSCTYCNFKTHKILYLNNHVKRNHTNHEKKYACEFCSFETAEKFDFYSHVKDVHEKNGDKINKCNHCPFRTRWKSHLYLHIKNKHTEDVEITYHNCKKCLFQTRWKSHLYKHIKDKHSLDRSVEYYNCENCDFQTKWQSHLYKHRKTKHPGVVYQRRHSRRSLVNHENIQKLFNKSTEEVQGGDIEEMIENFNDKKRKRTNETSLNQTDGIENSKHIEMKNSNQSGTFTSVWESFVYSCGNEQAENKRKLDNENRNNSNDEEGIVTKDDEIKYNLRKRDSKTIINITKKEVSSNKKQKRNNDKTPEKWNIDDSKFCVVEMKKDNACNVNLCKIQSLSVNKSRSEETIVKKRESKGKATIKKQSKVNEGSRKSKAKKSKDEKKGNAQNEQVEGHECGECSFKTQRMSKLKTHKLLAHAKK